MKAIKLTENSWFIQDNDQTHALVSKTLSGYATYTHDGVKEYSWEELESIYGTLTEEVKQEDTTSGPGGFPVRHEEFYNIDEDSDVPTYTVTPHSHIKYYPGYWILQKEGKNSMAFCPKVSTVETKNGIGPYKERVEALAELNLMNSKVK